MKTKLEVIRINEDVIATSNFIGVIKIEKEEITDQYFNTITEFWINTKETDETKAENAYAQLLSFYHIGNDNANLGVSKEGYYHLNSDGRIGTFCNNIAEHPGIENVLK